MKSDFTFIYSAPKVTDEKLPAVFLFHGYRSDEKDLLSLVANLESTHHIFSVRGPLSFMFGGYAFWDMQDLENPNLEQYQSAVESVQNFIVNAITQYNLEKKDITLLGFSQGAVLVQSIALRAQKLVNKVVALSGHLPYFAKDEEYATLNLNKLHIFISNGINDNVLPYAWGKASADYFKKRGADVTFKSYFSGHYVSRDNARDLIDFIVSN